MSQFFDNMGMGVGVDGIITGICKVVLAGIVTRTGVICGTNVDIGFFLIPSAHPRPAYVQHHSCFSLDHPLSESEHQASLSKSHDVVIIVSDAIIVVVIVIVKVVINGVDASPVQFEPT